jgi:hypothetical protein
MHWWELSRAEWLRSVLCHLVWDGSIATELRVTWLSDGLRIYIICIIWLYIFFDHFIIYCREQFRSRVLWHGTIRDVSPPTLGATCLERVTPSRFRSRVPWWHVFVLKTAQFRSRVLCRSVLRYRMVPLSSSMADECTVPLSSSVALVTGYWLLFPRSLAGLWRSFLLMREKT